MKVLFDTSGLIATVVGSHPHPQRAAAWLRRAKAGEIELLASAHTLAELFAVLTRLPLQPRISPTVALTLIRENILACAEIVALDAGGYIDTLERSVGLGLCGGVIYDALHLTAGQKASVDTILTLNDRDYSRAWPEQAGIVTTP